MATFQLEVSIAANTTVNVLAGTRIENLPPQQASRVALAANASATGLNGTCFIGNRNPLETSNLSLINRMPQIPEDLIFNNEPGLPGEKMVLDIQNTTVGALTAFVKVVVTPIPRRR